MAFRIYLVHLCTCSLENIHVGGNFLSRGIEKGMAYAKFKAHRFAFLNVTTIGPDNVVKAGSECGLACVNSLSCLSFNLAVFHGMNGNCYVNYFQPTFTTTRTSLPPVSNFITIASW